MLDFLCAQQPRYDYGDKTPAAAAPTMPSLFDGLGLSALWQAPGPHYEGQPAAASSSSPGLLCWMFGSPTPAYQTATPPPAPPSSSVPRQTSRDPNPGR